VRDSSPHILLTSAQIAPTPEPQRPYVY
jgi:hypothetical protein